MKRFLFVTSELVFIIALPIFGILSGGGFYLLKMGQSPTGWQWSIAPAIALAVFIAIVGAICGYGAINATAYHWTIRAYLGGVWMTQVATNCLVIPIYFSASRMASQSGEPVSFQAAVENLLATGTSGRVEWMASFAMTFTGELGLCGLLLVMSAMSREKAETEKREEVKTLGEDRVVVVDAIRESPYQMLSRREIAVLTDLKYNHVDRIVRSLVDEGVLVSDGKPRDAKFSLASE